MKCVKCGEDLRFFRRDIIEAEWNTDADGDQQDWVDEELKEEREKWYRCGCEGCPYVVAQEDGNVVAQLRTDA
jgi:hypothetical protein